MTDPRIEKLASVLVHYSTAVKPDDKVIIIGDDLAAPLLKAVYAEVLKAGGHPLMQISLSGIEQVFYEHASQDQLLHVPEPLKIALETYDVRIRIGGEANTKALSGVDPAKIVTHKRGQSALLKTFMERSASGALRWTSTRFPTNAYAQDAGMSLQEYQDFVYNACMPDMEDPIGYWKQFAAWQQKIVDWFKGKESVHVIGPDTDLHLSVAGRTFINSDGKHNMPSGEVFTGPVEESVQGHVRFSYPALYSGQELEDVQLWFKDGQVSRASAGKNEALLHQAIETDPGARYLGEFAIGTNTQITRFTRQILFDEKIGGSFHIALGAGYPETGSKNESAIHWDLICDLNNGGEIWVDGELLHKNGRFVIDF